MEQSTKWAPRDTGFLQMKSVINYMSVLGYGYFAPTHSFGSGWGIHKGREWISLNTAIKLYNGVYMDWHGKRFREPYHNIPEELYLQAKKNKLLLRVKLQYSRKKGVIVQDHRIQFVHPEQADLFFKDE